MDPIIFQSNQTWLWLLLFGGIAMFFSGLLYLREKNLNGPSWLKLVLGVIRFFIFFILLTLFIEPFMVQNKVELEKPGLLILADNSASMLQHDDSVLVKSLSSKISDLEQKIQSNFKVFTHQFSSDIQDSLNLGFEGKSTNIYKTLSSVKQQYYQEPIAGMLLITDGISNDGYDPKHIAEQFKFPIFTLGVGDSIQYPDLKLDALRYNEYSFLGNDFPVSLVVNAKGLQGETCKLVLKNSKGEVVYNQNVAIDKPSFSKRIAFNLTSEKTGMQYYNLTLSPLNKERNTANNSEIFGVEVIDSRKKLLVLSDGPHPDIGAIKEVLEDNNDLEIVLKEVVDKVESNELEMFDLVWIYQPSSSGLSRWMGQIRKLEIPYIVQLGVKSDFNLINTNFPSLKVNLRKQVVEDFSYAPNSEFSYFKLGAESIGFLKDSPPLRFPLSRVQFTKEYSVLAFQNVEGIDTENPLICFSRDDEIKTAWIFGEGLWKWKMNDYRQNESFEHFSSLLDKMIQYLSVKKDRRRLRVKIPKKIVGNRPVLLAASFYNESYDLDNSPEINFKLTDQNGKSYNFQFERGDEDYSMQFSGLPVGKYDYKISVETPGDFSQTGTLLIIQNDLELLETKSNFSQLATLSSLNEGKFFYLADWAEMEAHFSSINSPKIRYDLKEKTLMQEMPWILYFVLGLLFIEWFFRKYFGVL